MSHGTTRYCGIDLGDKYSHVIVLDEQGEEVERARLKTNSPSLQRWFGKRCGMRIAVEVGTHSRWVWRLLASLGHEVTVANPRQLSLIFKDARKSDWKDAEFLARLLRLDPKLLHPVKHRGMEAQQDLAILKARGVLVRVRTELINHVRASVKSHGARLPRCSADSFARKVDAHLPSELWLALSPLVERIGELTDQIRAYDRQIEAMCRDRYPETGVLTQIRGVGSLTALAFVLTLEDPTRFRRSRDVGPYLGLVPKKDESGQQNPQLGISKCGDVELRRLLVGAAHYILGPFGTDCDLRRHGERIAARGGPNAKKRAVVAVARKLAVLMHRLWMTGQEYEPLRNQTQRIRLAA